MGVGESYMWSQKLCVNVLKDLQWDHTMLLCKTNDECHTHFLFTAGGAVIYRHRSIRDIYVITKENTE